MQSFWKKKGRRAQSSKLASASIVSIEMIESRILMSTTVTSVADMAGIVAPLSPALAYDGGGTPISIAGSGFTGATGVSVNGVAATNVKIVSDTQITATVGATSDGVYSVAVQGSGGTGSGGSIKIGDTIAALQSLGSQTPAPTVTLGAADNAVVSAILSQPGTVNGVTYGNWAVSVTDASGSMELFGTLPGGYIPTVGDTISVNGTWSPFDQIPELGTVTAISKTGTGTPVNPTSGTVAGINVNPVSNANGGHLITLTNATISGEGASFGTTNSPAGAKIADVSGSMTLFYWPTSYAQANAFFDGIAVPTSPVSITGIVDVFGTTPEFVPMYINGETPEPFTATVSPAPSGIDNFANVNRGSDVTVTVTRPSGTSSDTATISYSTADESAIAGADYTAASGTLTFNAGVTSRQFVIHTSAASVGSKIFTINLGTPTGGTGFLPSYVGGPATVVIQDPNTLTSEANNSYQENATVQVKTGTNPNGVASSTSTVQIEANNVGNGNFASFGVLDYNDQTNDPSHIFNLTNPIGNVTGVELETVSTGSSFARSGPLNVYVVTDTTSSIVKATSTLAFDKTDDPTEGVYGQLGTQYLLGTINFNASQPTTGYTAYDLTTLNSSGISLLESALTAGTKFRIVVTPGDSVASAAWVGSNTTPPLLSPIIRINYAAPSTLPAWLAAGSVATWDAGSKTLTVTGNAAIIADPGSDEPNIVASGASAQLRIEPPSSPTDVHIGGVSLSGGAGIDVLSVGTARSHTKHNVLVIGTLGASADPTISVDSSSKINLEDNDLMVHTGTSDTAGSAELSAIAALAATGRHVAPGGIYDGTWNGDGLTSSAAASVDSLQGYEQNILAVVRNSDMFLGGYTQWTVGNATESLGANDILVKYTYNGDLNLDGAVDGNAATIFSTFYDGGASTGNFYSFGDLNGDGKIDGNDATIFSTVYGLGVPVNQPGGQGGSVL